MDYRAHRNKRAAISGEDQATSDLALEASKNALKYAGLKARELDLIIVATMYSRYASPARLPALLQHRLDAKKAAAFDINAACSGFIYGLSVANSFIRSGQYKKILLVGAETLSRFDRLGGQEHLRHFRRRRGRSDPGGR